MKTLFWIGFFAILCSCAQRKIDQSAGASSRTALELIRRGEVYSAAMRRYASQFEKSGGEKKPPAFSWFEEFLRLPRDEMVLFSIYVLSDPTLDGERVASARRFATAYEEIYKESILLGIKKIRPEIISFMANRGNGSVTTLNANLERLLTLVP